MVDVSVPEMLGMNDEQQSEPKPQIQKLDAAARKTEQLGMSISTANVKLLKKLLYDRAERLGELECYRCGDQIEEADFSVKHVRPWMDVDPALYWDLTNVVFAHSSCGTPVTAPTEPRSREQLQDSGRLGMHRRWHVARGVTVPGCVHCDEARAEQ